MLVVYVNRTHKNFLELLPTPKQLNRTKKGKKKTKKAHPHHIQNQGICKQAEAELGCDENFLQG